ncbi:MAG: nitronate monooxygenase [Sorangiineae bacterium]|nr:nitronate monooxygenase [Polyangiaceae bacterium]MEB2321406.1 nitronate monooxygenase [Sorangiineae bacterium]
MRVGGVFIEHPILQAGMAGGLSGARLAAAVSSAGGLGTVGMLGAEPLERELSAAKARTERPVAVNLLLPFLRRAHLRAARVADIIVTFWGPPRRLGPQPWFHQAGSVAEARAALDAGADAVILQGSEAGGHVRGERSALELLAAARRALPGGARLIVAGGVAGADDVRRALDGGADAVSLGTRFLLSEESGAHPLYKARVLASERTLVTTLFGMGWPAPHRVVPNLATSRFHPPPRWLGAVHRASAALARLVPLDAAGAAARWHSAERPLYSPSAPLVGDPDALIDAAPLYAGESARRIDAVLPAAELVRELLRGR